jgi:putative transposase
MIMIYFTKVNTRCGGHARCISWHFVFALAMLIIIMVNLTIPYAGFRFPVEIISHCVWLYHRFPLSLRDVEEMMLQRGIVVSHETVRQWCAKFGQTCANGLRRLRPRPGDKWHLDEVFIKIQGKTHYLWRAVDQDGNVLDILVTSRRDTTAATRFFRKLLKGLEYVPRDCCVGG